jgi:hypothetical protein
MYEFEEDYEDEYVPPIPRRRATVGRDVTYDDRKTEVIPVPVIPRKRRRIRLKAWFLTGMVIMSSLWLLGMYVVIPWYEGIVSQWHYGDAKVFLTGADVGHNGFSRFIADDNAGEIIIVECVGKKYTAYTAETLVGPGSDHRIVTLEIRDVNHDGKLDIVVSVEGMSMELVLYNTGTSFSWTGK